MGENVLEMRKIVKRYPGVVALNGVDFMVKKGEGHALLGENGAGKSTLIKILAGSVQCDEGTICFDSKEYAGYTPFQALQMGISVIYQEFNLISKMSVEKNIFFGRELHKQYFSDEKAMYNRTKEIFASLGVEIDPEENIANLSVAYQQLTEIAKAILYDAKIIVMDEPSATLTENELKNLFKLIKRLKEQGTTVIYISHRLEEIFEIADRLTVLRDGELVGTKAVADTNQEELIRMMVGRSLTGEYPENNSVQETCVLEVKNLTNSKIRGVSFALRKGEILGLTGLVGAGRTELVRALFGADEYEGEIFVEGKRVTIRSPLDAIRNGISLLPEDRKAQGVLLEMGVEFNASLPILPSIACFGFVNRVKERELVQKYVRAIRIKTPTLEQKVKNLSGGNQQKVIIAKWMLKNCSIFIFDEPTRGIDVGAKKEIYDLMNQLVKEGKSIIMVSSELPELLGMSDRVLVMAHGEITGELPKQQADQEKILAMSSL